MSYLVLARKYRPTNFDDVIGQDHITEILKKAITSQRVAHAYLFCGPRGIGKTSCARILAKSLNCTGGPSVTVPPDCPICKEIDRGMSFDVLEIDGASNRGIEEIRTLRENVKFAPGVGRFKIYIVDEVHMLTTEAFNALLKTLEEPPEHVKFIFATTDPNKVPLTIISRCQKFDFKRISLKTLVDSLNHLCRKENFNVEQDALYAIAKAAQGSFRDALSILDQISAFKDRTIKGEDIYSMLGLIELDLLFALTDALAQKDCAVALEVFDNIIEKGKDIKQLAKDLVEHFRNLMIVKIGGKTLGNLIDYPVTVKDMYLTQSEKFSLAEILANIDIFIDAQDVARITESLRTPLEIAFARISYESHGADRQERAAVAVPEKAAFERNSGSASAVLSSQQKPEVAISAASENKEALAADSEDNSSNVSLELGKLKKLWDTLTYAVSREKMSLATYLQEGFPYECQADRLTIGFAPEFSFHKESLEAKEAIQLVQKVFSEKLKTKVLITYKIIDSMTNPKDANVEPLVKSALDTFQGKIVSSWHKE